MPQPDFDGLVLQAYTAALDEEHWPAFLTSLADALGAIGGMVVMLTPSTPERSWTSIGRLDGALHEKYLAQFQENPATRQFGAATPIVPIFGDEVTNRLDVENTPVYQEIMRPQGIANGAILPLPPQAGYDICGVTTMLDARERRSREDMRALLTRLGPHLQLAFATSIRLAKLSSLSAALGDALDRATGPVFAVDPDGRVLFANASAQAILRDQDGLVLQDGRLAARHPTGSRRLRRLIAQASRTSLGLGSEPGGAFRLECPSGEEPRRVMVSPTADRRPFGPGGRPTALVFVSDAARPCEQSARARALADLYALTPTEARVAIKIADAQGLKAAAQALRIGHETARTHLKRVFDKTGARSQARLARLVTELVA